jgi:hypothetical protein
MSPNNEPCEDESSSTSIEETETATRLERRPDNRVSSRNTRDNRAGSDRNRDNRAGSNRN